MTKSGLDANRLFCRRLIFVRQVMLGFRAHRRIRGNQYLPNGQLPMTVAAIPGRECGADHPRRLPVNSFTDGAVQAGLVRPT